MPIKWVAHPITMRTTGTRGVEKAMMKTIRTLALVAFAASGAYAQCGKLVLNPLTNLYDCVGVEGTTSAGWTYDPVAHTITSATGASVVVGTTLLPMPGFVNIMAPAVNGGNTIDLTGVTDSTAGMQAALNYIATAGGTLYFPQGIYKHHGLTLTGTPQVYVSLVGASGYASTKLNCVGSATNALLVQNNNYASISHLDFTTDGTCTNGLVITSTGGVGSNSSGMTLENVQAGNFTSGAGMEFGSSGNNAASEILLNNTLAYNNSQGYWFTGLQTGSVSASMIHATANTVAYQDDTGSSSVVGWNHTINGGGFSQNTSDFIKTNPGSLVVNGLLSEGVANSSSGTFLLIGSAAGAGSNSSGLTSVILNGVIAYHNTSFSSNRSILAYAPASIEINNSIIGMGQIYMSGVAGTSQSALQVNDSRLWWSGGGLPWIQDTGNYTIWNVSVRRSYTGATPNTASALLDTDYAYNTSGAVVTTTDSKWSTGVNALTTTGVYGFTGTASAAADVGLSRLSAGLIGVGTGAAGSSAGSVRVSSLGVAVNPSAPLDVSGSNSLSVPIVKITPGTGASTDTGIMGVNGRSAFGYDGARAAVIVSDNAASKPIVLDTSGVERVRIYASGAGVQILPQTADPGCTTTAHIGKIWFDNTTTTTAAKKCVNVAGTLTWVAF